MVGSVVRVDVLECAWGGGEVIDAVEELLDAGLLQVSDASNGDFGFSHDLVREAVYGEVSPLRRARLHRAVADALDAMQDTHRPPPLAEVARHLHLAAPAGVDPARAVEYDVRAAEAATRVLAYEDAAGHYQRAVEGTTSRDATAKGELLLALGDARWRAGDSARAREAFLDAAGLGRTVGNARLVGRAVIGFGGGLFRDWHTSRGETNDKTVIMLEEALEGLGHDEEALRVRLLGHLAEELYYVAPAEQRDRLSREAVAIAERLGDAQLVASALCSRCLALWSPDHLEERLALATRIVALGEGVQDPELWLFGQHYLTLARLESCDVEGALAALRAYERRAEVLRQPLFLWRARVTRTHEALLAARFGEAQRLAEEALRMGEEAQEPDAFNIYAVQLGMALMEEDRLEELRPLMEQLTEQLPETPWWDTAMAFIDAATGRLDEARPRFERLATDGFARLPMDFGWTVGMALLALVNHMLGDRDHAVVLHRLLEPYAATNAMAASRGSWGSVAMYLGVVATTAGEYDRAQRWFEQAVVANEHMGAMAWVAHTRYHHARMLLLRDAPGDRSVADDLLREADRAAGALGMKRLGRLVKESASNPPSRGPHPRYPPHPRTRGNPDDKAPSR